jgi:hypothetical protein
MRSSEVPPGGSGWPCRGCPRRWRRRYDRAFPHLDPRPRRSVSTASFGDVRERVVVVDTRHEESADSTPASRRVEVIDSEGRGGSAFQSDLSLAGLGQDPGRRECDALDVFRPRRPSLERARCVHACWIEASTSNVPLTSSIITGLLSRQLGREVRASAIYPGSVEFMEVWRPGVVG